MLNLKKEQEKKRVYLQHNINLDISFVRYADQRVRVSVTAEEPQKIKDTCFANFKLCSRRAHVPQRGNDVL